MDLTFWYKHGTGPYREVDMDRVFSEPGKLLLVENQAEHDFLSGMQYLFGTELRIQIAQDDSHQQLWQYWSYYLTWNPVDRVT
jgi:hypothetical protein